MSILRFYWLRHAPPVNPQDLCYGQMDIGVDLSDDAAFEQQAKQLPPNSVWLASPLGRTLKTAEKLAAFHENAKTITIATDPSLMEQSFGRWETRSRADLRNDPDFIAYRKSPETIRPPEGESMNTLASRVIPAIDALVTANRKKGGDFVMVAHGGTIRAALHHATGMAMADTLRLGVAPLSLTVIEYDMRKLRQNRNPWVLASLNLKP